MKTYAVVEIDCVDDKCGKCLTTYTNGSKCPLFGELAMDTNGYVYRAASCFEAEAVANAIPCGGRHYWVGRG